MSGPIYRDSLHVAAVELLLEVFVESDRKRLSRPGVYQIVNKITGQRYIGSSKNLYKRWKKHQSQLRLQRHENRRLQASYDLHGPAAFHYGVIVFCQEEELLDIEQDWLDAAEPEFNLAKFTDSSGRGLKLSEYSKARISAAKIHTGLGYCSYVNKKSGITYWRVQWRPAHGGKRKFKHFRTQPEAAAFVAEIRAKLTAL